MAGRTSAGSVSPRRCSRKADGFWCVGESSRSREGPRVTEISRIFRFSDGQMSYEDVGADFGLTEDESFAVAELISSIRHSVPPSDVDRLTALLKAEGRIAEDIAGYAMLRLVAEYQSRLRRGAEKHGLSFLGADHIRFEAGEDGTPVPTLDLSEERAASALAALKRAIEAFLSPDEDFPDESSWRVVAESVWSQALLLRAIASPEAATYAEALHEDLGQEHGDALDYLRDRRKRHYLTVAQDFAEEYVDALDAGSLHPQQLEALVGLAVPSSAEAAPVPEKREGHWYSGASLLWQRTREVVAQGAFGRVEGSPWPTADVTAPSRKISGHAVLRPPRCDGGAYMSPEEVEMWAEIMWRQREELSDLNADMLDALCAVWIAQAKDPRDTALASVDDLLRMRGLRPKLGGAGRRGGYEPSQREAVTRALAHLENIWLTVSEMEVYEAVEGRRRTKARKLADQSRVFVLTDRVGQMRLDGGMEVERFRFRPGDVFARYLGGPGRQVALLSAAALAYDPYREVWEKRLAKYLSWKWKAGARSGHHQPYRVDTLLERAGQEVKASRPLRTRERLEKALDRLHGDGVIAGWQYDRFHDRLANSREGWVKGWLTSTVIIEPPEVVKGSPGASRKTVARGKKIPNAGGSLRRPAETGTDPLAERTARRRKELKLSQLRLAERLGVSQALVSMVERGRESPSPALRKKIEAWLDE